MKRPPKPDEVRLWSRVAATVHPLPGRETPEADAALMRAAAPVDQPMPIRRPHAKPPRTGPLSDIEPNRKKSISKDHLEARIDLHGMTQDRARAALEGFLLRVWDEGYRSALVITGKGLRGDGVLRRHAPEWLASHKLDHVVAGISVAHEKHGGDGALYVALKRKPRV
jgi:DNA-nicking Smr family endonuclease